MENNMEIPQKCKTISTTYDYVPLLGMYAKK
jgi:hypothetical protein